MFFFSSHVWMWKLDHKNWCFWTVMLKKTLESPLDCKEIKPVNPKPVLNIHWKDWCGDCNSNPLATWCDLTHWKRSWCGNDWRQEEKGMTEDVMVGWHHWFDGHKFEQTPGVGVDREAWRSVDHGVTMSWLFTSGGQSIGFSALASVLPMNNQVDFH